MSNNDTTDELQNELRDLNKNLKKSSEETRRFSLVLVVLAFMQMATALWWFLFEIQISENKWLGLLFTILLGFSMFLILKSFWKDK